MISKAGETFPFSSAPGTAEEEEIIVRHRIRRTRRTLDPLLQLLLLAAVMAGSAERRTSNLFGCSCRIKGCCLCCRLHQLNKSLAIITCPSVTTAFAIIAPRTGEAQSTIACVQRRHPPSSQHEDCKCTQYSESPNEIFSESTGGRAGGVCCPPLPFTMNSTHNGGGDATAIT